MATDQPQTEQSTHVWAIYHPPDTKYLTLFLTTETIQTCFSNWKINFSWSSFGLTTAVFFWFFFFPWSSIYSCDSSSKTFSQPPSHSWACTYPHHRCTQRYKPLPPYLHSLTSLGCSLLQHCSCSSPTTRSQICVSCTKSEDQDKPCTSQIPEQCTSCVAQDHCGIRAGRQLSKTQNRNDFILTD